MHTYQAIFFDLDGTLLPMDLEVFTNTYFGLLAKRFPQFDSKVLLDSIWKGTKAMITNDGSMTNEARFWTTFAQLMGADVLEQVSEFDRFYLTDFHKAKAICGENPMAREIINFAHEKAEHVVLATNPLFPLCAVESRLGWIGLQASDFSYITSYENSSFCKPTAAYYQHICQAMELDPAQCLMIGNDVREDAWGASQAGLQTHIVTDCLISHNMPLEDWSHSTFADLKTIL